MPQGVVGSDTVMVSAVVADEQSGLMKVTIAVDGGDAVTVLEADPDNVVNRQQVSSELTELVAGMREVVVVAESEGGPTTYSWTFTVDETPPEIASGMPRGVIGSDTAMVSAVVSDEQSGLMKVTIAVDGGDAMTVLEGDPDNVVNRQQVSHEATGLTAGMHEVVVVAESMGGPTTYSWTFTVDETPPEIASGMPRGVIGSDTARRCWIRYRDGFSRCC
jgi:hypothetical protein